MIDTLASTKSLLWVVAGLGLVVDGYSRVMDELQRKVLVELAARGAVKASGLASAVGVKFDGWFLEIMRGLASTGHVSRDTGDDMDPAFAITSKGREALS